jgi:hypothetical protein
MSSVPSSRSLYVLLLLVASLAGAACSKEPAASAAGAAAPPAAATAAGEPATAASATGEITGGAAPAAVRTVTGSVVETMNAANYTYLRLDTGDEKIWAATIQIDVKVGDRLVVPLEMSMRNFHAEKLGRDFPIIYFSSSVSREGGAPVVPVGAAPAAAPDGQAAPAAQAAPAGQGMPAMPAGHPPVGGAAKAPVTVTEVIPPAPGGRSVADVWAQRTALAGKPVVVRGKVVKFLAGIMGRNWIHLQDGTGNAKDGTNDITVTTEATVAAGDLVTATGILLIDKDFGSGYRYAAIVENATIAK